VPRAPTRAFSSGLELGAGTDDYWSASGYLSGALPGGAVLGRLAAGTRNASGTEINQANRDSLGDLNRDSVAGTLATSSEGPWTAKVSARWSRTWASQPPESSVDASSDNCGAIDPKSAMWTYYCGSLPQTRKFDLSPGVPDSSNEVAQTLLAIAWNTGPFVVESDTSYYRGSSVSYRDFDASSTGEIFGVCTASVNCPQAQTLPQVVDELVRVNSVSKQAPSTEEWDQEFRLRGPSGGAFDWMLGLTGHVTRQQDKGSIGFSRGNLGRVEALTVLLPLTPYLVGPVARANRALVGDPDHEQVLQLKSETTRHNFAVFGALGCRLTDQIGLRAELRSTWERISLDSHYANFGPSFGEAVPAQHFSDLTPRFSIDFQPAPNALVYASAAKGSRSGGINPIPDLLSQEQLYEPEYNWTYEIAGRYRDANERWSGNLTLYYIDWHDTQLLGFSQTPGVGNLITRNTAGVSTQGVELTAAARLHPLLALQGAFSYADPEFKSGSDDPGSSSFCGLSATNHVSSFCRVGPSRDANAPPGTYVPYIDGNQLQRAPREQWQIGLRLELPPSSSGWLMSAATDVSYQSKVYDRAIDGASYGERKLLAARVGASRGPWTIELWGTNLTDENYVRAASSRGAAYYPVSPRPLDLVYGDGRRIGLTLRYEQ
jgi:iron complex outermembrane receptor protein